MFKYMHTYTHTSMLDCMVLVRKSFKIRPKRYKLKIRWFTRTGMDMGIDETIDIYEEQFDKWVEFQVP